MIWIALVVGIIAFATRLLLVAEVVHQLSPGELRLFGGDSRQYIDLARNFNDLGTFANDRPGRREGATTYFSLLRPPVYPLFCAAYEAMGWRAGILWTQTAIGASLPVMLVLLTYSMLRSRVAACCTGLASALSPTGIGLPGIILADLPYAAAFLAGFAFLWLARNQRAHWYYLAGATFGFACLIKPAGLYWPLLIPPVAWLMSHGTGTLLRWRHAFGATALCIALMLGWAARNYSLAGIFTVSTIDAQNLRYYVMPRVEKWLEAGELPQAKKVKRHRGKAMARDVADLAQGMTHKEIVKRQWSESLATFRAHPRLTWTVYWQNVEEHFETRFNFFDAQMPRGGWKRDLLIRVEEWIAPSWFFWTCAGMMLCSLGVPPLVPIARRDPTCVTRWFASVAVALTLLYLTVFCGTTTNTGSRILYPAQFAMLLLIAGGAVSLVRDIPRLSRTAGKGETPQTALATESAATLKSGS